MNSRRGQLIVVEGCDRSGKSTQCERLVQRLQNENHNVQLLKFPDRTTQTGKMIDSYLKQSSNMNDQAIHLLFSANRWEAVDTMASLLQSGKSLVVDRYAYSGVAFSSAKGLDLTWCKNPDVGLLIPDVVLFLDLPIAEAEKRGGFGDERYEKKELQMKVRDQFMKLKDEQWKIIDAAKSMDQVHHDIWQAVQPVIHQSDSKALRYDLWK
ncbi:hypothetical protein DFQ28_005243 [Apophysomyces sp. BC1034]|nr:hypothetical protein DFQ30_003411 [Apophysomyces sp. BC1015]KAG0182827.1 hypothetical protein DFQ29_001993 [Apophysomyces sp. BC1021]KAG0193426.1 hypothetical protein DFQ28_005243 [Apophysomyces sp. BC1034]